LNLHHIETSCEQSTKGELEDQANYMPSFLACGPRDSGPSGKPEGFISGVAKGLQQITTAAPLAPWL